MTLLVALMLFVLAVIVVAALWTLCAVYDELRRVHRALGRFASVCEECEEVCNQQERRRMIHRLEGQLVVDRMKAEGRIGR